MSQREASRQFGISRDSVQKMLSFSFPPGYRRSAPVRRPKLDGFTGIIDQWLAEDRDRPRKQRHTAKRIFEPLRDEHGFEGGYTIIKDYVREHGRRHREMFVPLDHAPGHAQEDFGEAVVVIGGVEQKAHFFALDLPHSDSCYIRAYPAATAEAWMDGHARAFGFFGGVPLSILYDNDRCLVAKIEPDGIRASSKRRRPSIRMVDRHGRGPRRRRRRRALPRRLAHCRTFVRGGGQALAAWRGTSGFAAHRAGGVITTARWSDERRIGCPRRKGFGPGARPIRDADHAPINTL